MVWGKAWTPKGPVTPSGLSAPTNQDHVVLVGRKKVLVMIPAQRRVSWVVLKGRGPIEKFLNMLKIICPGRRAGLT